MKTKQEKLLARKALRAPFVITVAGAGAVLGTVGCGDDDIANPPMTLECPTEAPLNQPSCAQIGLRCSYGDCNGQPNLTATCKEGGQWEFAEASCNPPVPQCPEETPSSESACSSEGLSCRYGDCYGTPTITAECSGGAWSVAEMSCNPPVPQCPEEAPSSESVCLSEGLSCRYGDCYGTPTITAECSGGAWSVAEMSCNPPMPQCPEEAPSSESACLSEGQSCQYGDCDGVPTITAECGGGQWQVAEVSCNPPTPPIEVR